MSLMKLTKKGDIVRILVPLNFFWPTCLWFNTIGIYSGFSNIEIVTFAKGNNGINV